MTPIAQMSTIAGGYSELAMLRKAFVNHKLFRPNDHEAISTIPRRVVLLNPHHRAGYRRSYSLALLWKVKYLHNLSRRIRSRDTRCFFYKSDFHCSVLRIMGFHLVRFAVEQFYLSPEAHA